MSDRDARRAIQDASSGGGMVPSSGTAVVPGTPTNERQTRRRSRESPQQNQGQPQIEARSGQAGSSQSGQAGPSQGGQGRVQGFEIGMNEFTRAMSGAFAGALEQTNVRLVANITATENLLAATRNVQAAIAQQTELTRELGIEMQSVKNATTAQTQNIGAVVEATRNTAQSTATLAGRPQPNFQQNVTVGNLQIDNAIGPQIDPEVSEMGPDRQNQMLETFETTGYMNMYGGININPLTMNPETEEEEMFIPKVLSEKALEYYWDPGWRKKTKKELEAEFDRIGAQYVAYPNEENEDIVKRLDFVRKIQAQNRAYAALMKGEQSVPKGHTPTSMFSSEKITGVANDGSPIGKVIAFTNGIDQITIKADGNGGYYGVQAGKKYGPRTYKEIERWAYLGGFQAKEMKELKQVIEVIKNPEKLKTVVFRARKL